ncbi:MAG: hypothetical protein RL754_1394 [Bacteroidota bacterium]|jgi:PKD repeat protein
MQKYILSLLSGLFILLSTQAQAQKCGHDVLEAELDKAHPERAAQWQEVINSIDFERENSTEGTVYTVPVVVHIIYDDAGDNISDKQVRDAIAVINEDYRRLNADTSNTRATFKSVAADTEIEFRLAQLDPNGNCTTGITRTQSALSVDANNNVKSIISWPRTKYLNIWVVNNIDLNSSSAGTVLGYAYKPSPGQTTTYDGIVIRHDCMGRIGTSVNNGRTLTHEAGHYLGLDHPFNGGCFQGDNCDDTPPVSEASFGCDLTANSCSNDFPNLPDQIENYMDYADDDCTNMFTLDQKAIMRNSLTTSNLRGYLVTSTNQDATGLTPGIDLGCAPEAFFGSNLKVVCEGSSIQFNDLSRYNPTSWKWNFAGGTPATSTAANPVVTYNTPGNYNVQLEVTNANGSTVLLEEGEISVRSSNNFMWVNQFSGGFEFHDIPNGSWHVENPDKDAIKWIRTDKASYAGDYAVELANFNNLPDNTDAIVTDKIAVGKATGMIFSFRYAVAARPGGTGDIINVLVSDDCGQSWQSVRAILGPLLYSATNKTTYWRPTSANQWRNVNISLNEFAGGDPIMVKVEFISGGGNNAFFDDFNLAVTLGEEELGTMPISLYPNPNNGSFHLDGLNEGTAYRITDMQGRTIKTGVLGSAGNVDLHASAGYYLFQAGETRIPLIIQ